MPFRTLTFLLISLLTQESLQAQNLVPNGNLDSTNICTEYHAPCCPSGWFFTNWPGHGGAFKYHYLDLLSFDRDSKTRVYMQTFLLCPLQTGAKYHLKIKVAATYIGPNTHDIGFWFTDHYILSHGDSLLQPDNYVGFTDAQVKELGGGWFQLDKEMTATDNSQVLIIGNFAKESNAHLARKRGIKATNIMITDMSIENTQGGSCPLFQHTQDSLFAIHSRHPRPSWIKPTGLDTLQPGIAKSALPEPPPQRVVPQNMPPQHIDTLRIPDIDFEFNSYHLTDTTVLDLQRPQLQDKDITHILIAGYTDDKGTDAYNLNLSQQRAQQVAELLKKRYAIDDAILTTEGRGISHTYKNDAANRRVEIYIYH